LAVQTNNAAMVTPPICAHACVPDSNTRHKRSKATFGTLMTSPKGVNSSKRHKRSKATLGNLMTSPKGVNSSKRHRRSKATFGNLMTSPKGVNTNTPLPNSSSVTQSTNSRASKLPRKSCCHSRIELSQLTRRVMTCESNFLPPNRVFCTADTEGMLRNQGSVVWCCVTPTVTVNRSTAAFDFLTCALISFACSDKGNFLDTLHVTCLA